MNKFLLPLSYFLFPISFAYAAVNVSANQSLSTDTDWRGQGEVTVAAGATLDLAGHKLSLSSIAGAGTVTDTVGGGAVCMDVPAGGAVTNAKVVFAGKLRFVKAGPGEYRQAQAHQTYEGGTLVAAGTFCGKAKHLNSVRELNLGKAESEVRVEKGATLDLCDSFNTCYWNFVLNGGTLRLKDHLEPQYEHAQVQRLKLLADSNLYVMDSGFIGSGYGEVTLDLNGHELALFVENESVVHFFNTVFPSSGTLRFTNPAGGSYWMKNTTIDPAKVKVVYGAAKRYVSPLELGDFGPAKAAAGINLIPAPREMKVTGGEYTAPGGSRSVATAVEKVKGLPPEGYELSITKDGITIRHSDAAGLFYAKVTLSHLVRGRKTYPCLEIKDWPQFKWRGAMLDDSRHFMGKETVKHVLDLMSRFKLNVFHWHLTDDQLWTLEVPGYPELRNWGGEYLKEHGYFGEKMPNGIYTANDVKEILEYAQARHITVVPEIELPGHSASAIFAYPELCCFPEEVYSKNRDYTKFNYTYYTGIYCFGNPDTIRFLEKVLDYVCELFPSEVIHIGGDECFRDKWQRCPKCQAFMKREGLNGVAQIQPWVTRHFTEYLAKKGRRAIGWDQIFIESADRDAGGSQITKLLPKKTMGMCYRHNGAGAAAANQGYDIVMTPASYTYFDYSQGLAEDPFDHFGGGLTIRRVYQFDPLAGVEESAKGHVVGGQCCNWTSHTYNYFDLDWKMWPRCLALAEILWTYPDPKHRDFDNFAERASDYRLRLIRAHVNCAPLK